MGMGLFIGFDLSAETQSDNLIAVLSTRLHSLLRDPVATLLSFGTDMNYLF